jgi:phosphatidate phosphatase APP1
MPELYRRWQEKGALFHYVSASPRQLYESLSQFLHTENFPRGVLHLKQVKWRGTNADPLSIAESVTELLASPKESKIAQLSSLFTKFPQHRFILVGDAGEKDPEIYAEIARLFPSQIHKIAIRDEDPAAGQARYTEAFGGLPEASWIVFKNPSELNGVF